jgi:hypothetical protein
MSEPSEKQIRYAKNIAESLNLDLSKVPFNKISYWEFINKNCNQLPDVSFVNDAFEPMNHFDLGDFS